MRALGFSGDFVGRAQDLDAISRLFGEGARLVTLTGSAGIGKTRLALEWARSSTARAVVVDLATARDLDDAAAAIARALGAPIAALGSAQALVRLAEHVPPGDVVLVLDNLEQLASVSPELLEPFLDAPSLTVLATSRERLRLHGERVVALEPLGLPPAHATDAGAIGAAESVDLFLRRARAVRADAACDERTATTIAAIVRRLEGVPLAIELCAGRAAMMTPQQTLARLTRQLDLLVTGPRDAPTRHATLRAALLWSWELLNERERAALAQCGVFRGSFSLEAAEAVLALDGVGDRAGTGSALDVMQSLVDKSLVRLVDGRHGGRRFALLVSVRELANEMLATRGGDAAARARHRAHMLSADRREAARLDEEADDLTAIAEDALAATPLGAEDASAALRALLLLEPVVLACARGRLEPYVELLDRAIAAADDANDPQIARALYVRACADLLRGRPACAPGFTRALEAARAGGSRRDQAFALTKLGLLYEHAEQADLARAAFDEARAIASALGDAEVSADWELTRAGAAAWRGQPSEAAFHNARALEQLMALGDRDGACIAAGCLALALLNLDRRGEADAAVAKILELCASTEPRRSQGYALGTVARVAQARGRFADARATLERAIAIHRGVGDRWQEGMHAGLLGNVEFEAGDLEAAARAYQRSLGLLRDTPERNYRVIFRAALGAVEIGLGRDASARARFEGVAREVAEMQLVDTRVATELFRAHGAGAASDDAARALLLAESPAADGSPAPARASDLVRFAARMLRASRPATPRAPTAAPVLVVGAEGRWFRLGDGVSVELLKARGPRLLLSRLVRARVAENGAPVALTELFDAGWPGEHIAPRSAANRVYVALHKLKQLGLRDILQSRDDGVRLDPAVTVLEALDTSAR